MVARATAPPEIETIPAVRTAIADTVLIDNRTPIDGAIAIAARRLRGGTQNERSAAGGDSVTSFNAARCNLACSCGFRLPLSSPKPPNAPVFSQIDDTIIHKRGRHVAGTSWRRDPLGPAFADNFVWANRFLQISLALRSPKIERLRRAQKRRHASEVG